MALIAVVFGMLFFGVLGITMATFIANDSQSSGENLEASQAFYVAEGGMQYLIMNQIVGDSDLSNNVSPTDPPFGGNSISLSPGKFWVEYSNQQASSADIKVTAQVGNSVRVIQETASISGTSSNHYVAMAGGKINMNSSSGDVYKDVILKGASNISPNVVVHGSITQDPNLVLPTIDFATYKTMTTTTNNGDLTISSNYTGNLLVNGNVTIKANVTYTGLLYATGNISLKGNNIVFLGTPVTEGNFSGDGLTGLQFKAVENSQVHMPAILSKGGISFKNSDGMKLDGVVWSSGDIDFTNADDLNYNGSFIIGGNMLMNTANRLTITFQSDYVKSVPGWSSGQDYNAVGLSGWKTY